jgi:hypothetical protein
MQPAIEYVTEYQIDWPEIGQNSNSSAAQRNGLQEIEFCYLNAGPIRNGRQLSIREQVGGGRIKTARFLISTTLREIESPATTTAASLRHARPLLLQSLFHLALLGDRWRPCWQLRFIYLAASSSFSSFSL